MVSLSLFRKSAASEAADRVLAAVSAAARDPQWFGEGGVADSLEGRFEALAAFAALALERWSASPEAERVAQIFTDRLFRFVDAGLREAAVGDLSVPRKMKALAGAFYGRAAAYAGARDVDSLAEALGRNIPGLNAILARPLAERLLALRARFAESAPADLEKGELWR